jgi:hypothetical protein
VTTAGWQILVPTFVDGGMLRGQCGASPWPLSRFLDRFKGTSIGLKAFLYQFNIVLY